MSQLRGGMKKEKPSEPEKSKKQSILIGWLIDL